jgi:hypothetical protein
MTDKKPACFILAKSSQQFFSFCILEGIRRDSSIIFVYPEDLLNSSFAGIGDPDLDYFVFLADWDAKLTYNERIEVIRRIDALTLAATDPARRYSRQL